MKTDNRTGKHLSRIILFFLLSFSVILLCACVKPAVEEPLDGDGMEMKFISISAEEAKKMMEERDDCLIIDVRTVQEYQEEHIPGAVNVPVDSLYGNDLPEQIGLDKTLLIYCRSGNRSKLAAGLLFEHGFDTKQLYEFGGIIDWPYETVKSGEDDISGLIQPVLMLDAHEPAEKNGVILEVTEFSDAKLTARFENQSDETFWYGQPFEIMVRKDGEWVRAEWKEEMVWTMEAYELAPGESREISCDLSMMKELTSGEYLLVRNEIKAPFTLVYSE